MSKKPRNYDYGDLDDDKDDKYAFAKDFDEKLKDWSTGCTWKGVLDGMTKNTFILMGKVSNAS